MTGICQDLPPMEFDADTAVTATAEPGVFASTVSGRWGLPGGTANGGYLLAMSVQALRAVLPFPDPLVVSGHFLRPGVPGAATIRTEVVRAGRSIATGEALLLQDGREVVRAVASFGDLLAASGPSHVAGSMPDLPGSSTIELTVHVRTRPAPGWLACRSTTRFLMKGYHEEDFEAWDETGRLVAPARQLAVVPS
jgi:acyl-CoA thioesterase